MTRMSQLITFAVSIFVCITLGGRLLENRAAIWPLVGFFLGSLALGMTLSSWLMRRFGESSVR
jgi:hypothetical protein